MDLLPYLLPLDADLCVTKLTAETEARIVTVEIQTIAAGCACPSCQLFAQRVHSHYGRTVADLPWGELTVCLRLTVRKFFCDNPLCPRKIFTERLPTLVSPSSRRSLRLLHQQQRVALALGGNPSARLSADVGYPTSRNTFLRLVRRLPLPQPTAPKVVGVDDWAWKKGHRYGSIIVDLEQRRPIALLEERDAEQLAAWLKQYPTIRIVARDRAGVYAEGATKGAPQAVQVADRFHLLGNVADTLLPVFEQHAKLVREATRSTPTTNLPPDAVECQVPTVTEQILQLVPPAALSPKQQIQAEQRRAERLARYEQAHHFHAKGWPIRAISRELGLNRNTVRTYLRAASFPERQPRVLRQPGILEPFVPYLIERWNAGCRTGATLWKEIVEQGYTGKRVTVFSFVTRLRRALGIPAKNRTIQSGKVVAPKERPLTPRNAVWQVLQREEKRDEATVQRVEKLQQAHAELDEAITLTEAFATLIRKRDCAALDLWLDQAASSTLKSFRNFALSLRRDYGAVRAGVEQNWSTGPVEGTINKLKMVKRTMFGRAGFALLQRRILLTG